MYSWVKTRGRVWMHGCGGYPTIVEWPYVGRDAGCRNSATSIVRTRCAPPEGKYRTGKAGFQGEFDAGEFRLTYFEKWRTDEGSCCLAMIMAKRKIYKKQTLAAARKPYSLGKRGEAFPDTSRCHPKLSFAWTEGTIKRGDGQDVASRAD